MRSQRGYIDEHEEIRWILEEAERRGETLTEDVVKRVLLFRQAFELEIGNAVVVTRPCSEPAIICMGDGSEDMVGEPCLSPLHVGIRHDSA